MVLVAFLATHVRRVRRLLAGLRRWGAARASARVAPVIVTRGPDTVAPLEVSRLAAGVGTTPWS